MKEYDDFFLTLSLPEGHVIGGLCLSCLWCIQIHLLNSVFELSCNQACIFIRKEKFSSKKFKLFIDFHFCVQRKTGQIYLHGAHGTKRPTRTHLNPTEQLPAKWEDSSKTILINSKRTRFPVQ